MRPRLLALALLALPLALALACATGTDDPVAENEKDGQAPSKDGSTSGDGPSSCTLGSLDNCGTCGNACPAATDGTSSKCTDETSSATCEITCRGEFYDVDGKPENGCEAQDEPLQDNAVNAVPITLPDVQNDATQKSNPRNLSAALYHDGRNHEAAPNSRPFGREDWFKVTAVGAGNTVATMGACLSAVNFPTDNELEVCISADGSLTPTTCKTLVVTADAGGGSACVTPVGNPNTGTFMVRVKKTKGSPTANGYALYLNH